MFSTDRGQSSSAIAVGWLAVNLPVDSLCAARLVADFIGRRFAVYVLRGDRCVGRDSEKGDE
jgi:hypothetical protein